MSFGLKLERGGFKGDKESCMLKDNLDKLSNRSKGRAGICSQSPLKRQMVVAVDEVAGKKRKRKHPQGRTRVRSTS
jgi:hypothetical protein